MANQAPGAFLTSGIAMGGQNGWTTQGDNQEGVAKMGVITVKWG